MSIEVGAPNVALMNITGMAHCVRYLNMPRRYGWRVIDDVLGEATVVVPAHGRTTVKMFLVSRSAQISRAVVTLEFQYHKHTIGKICAPRKDT